MEEEGKIVGKDYNKSKIYFYNQALQPQLDLEEMNKVKNEQDLLRKANQELLNKIKELKAEIQRLDRTPTLDELQTEIGGLEEKIAASSAQVQRYKSNEVALVPEAEIKKVEQEKERAQVQMKRREKLVRDLVDAVCEATEAKTNKVIELMGLEC